MNHGEIRDCICKAIEEVQTLSGYECPTLTGTTIPATNVPEFKSEVWPIAIAMIVDMTEIDVPDDENLFYDKKTDTKLSIDQCAKKLAQIDARNIVRKARDND